MSTIITDIDECILGTDTCHHVCKNTIGSYTCVCGEGYRMAANGTCEGNALPTPQLASHCFNSSHSCPRGLICGMLSIADIDECVERNNNCEQSCTNIIGSYACSCSPGFMLSPNGFSCTSKLSNPLSANYKFTTATNFRH